MLGLTKEYDSSVWSILERWTLYTQCLTIYQLNIFFLFSFCYVPFWGLDVLLKIMWTDDEEIKKKKKEVQQEDWKRCYQPMEIFYLGNRLLWRNGNKLQMMNAPTPINVSIHIFNIHWNSQAEKQQRQSTPFSIDDFSSAIILMTLEMKSAKKKENYVNSNDIYQFHSIVDTSMIKLSSRLFSISSILLFLSLPFLYFFFYEHHSSTEWFYAKANTSIDINFSFFMQQFFCCFLRLFLLHCFIFFVFLCWLSIILIYSIHFDRCGNGKIEC